MTLSVWDPAGRVDDAVESMLTWWPAAIARAAEQRAGRDQPLLLQLPTAVSLLVTSTTEVFPSALMMSVPVGNVTVMC